MAEQPAPGSHLTDEQKAANGLAWLARLEALREEFAGLAEQPAQQEPVAWMFTDKEGTEFFEQREDWEGRWTPLYTSPPATKSWVGLTDEQVWACLPPDPDDLAFARAIEAKLREKNA